MDIALCLLIAVVVGIVIGMVLMYGIIDYEFYREIEEKDGDMYDFAQYCKRRK